ARGLPCERFTAALASRTSCITRGRGGWLDLPRGGLSPPILCQLPGALRLGSKVSPSSIGGLQSTSAIPRYRTRSCGGAICPDRREGLRSRDVSYLAPAQIRTCGFGQGGASVSAERRTRQAPQAGGS